MRKIIILLFLCTPLMMWAQERIITGKTTFKGAAINQVNIYPKEQKGEILSNDDGSFSIKVSGSTTILIFSKEGFKQKTVKLSSSNYYDVGMEEDNTELKVVNVKGFSNVIGTARRRAESVQKIPESVTTLTAEDIQKTGVTNVQSFVTQIPNVNFNTSQNVGVNFISVRGIPQIRNGDAPIAFVIDGVTVPDPNLINQNLYDLAMIEVVKGPQGALYGKNAIGGAINILTQEPSNTMKNELRVGYGNGETFKAQLSSSGALVKDKLFYRISGNYGKSRGLFYNNTNHKYVDFSENLGFRGQLKYVAGAFTATAAVQTMDDKGGATYYAHSPTGNSLRADDFNSIIDANVYGKSTLKGTFSSLRMTYDFDQISLKSVTSYNISKRYHYGDLDFTPVDFLRQEQNSDSKTFNQEFRLSNKNIGKLNWQVGAFYQKSSRPLITNGFIDNSFNPAALSGNFTTLPISNFTNTFHTIAAFGFLDYKLTDKLTASLGFRQDFDKITQDNKIYTKTFETNKNEFQPKVSLSYQASEASLIFANYGHGYRSGGFNSEKTKLFNASFKPETSDNFELGFKNTLWNNRLILNASAFYINFNNQQQYAVSLGSNGNTVIGNFNFDQSEIYGFELEGKLRMTNYLDLLANYGYNNSKILKGGTSGDTDRNVYDGNYTPYVNLSNFNIALQSSTALNKNLDFNAYLSFNGKGKLYWHEDNLPENVAPAYQMLDGRIGVTIAKKYEIAIWGNNLSNTKYYTEYNAAHISGAFAGDIVWKGRPRTFGMELNIKF